MYKKKKLRIYLGGVKQRQGKGEGKRLGNEKMKQIMCGVENLQPCIRPCMLHRLEGGAGKGLSFCLALL